MSMLVQIGKRSESADLVDLLHECHGRIRRFLVMGRQLARTPEATREEIAEAAGQIRRYFAESLPLHMADEDIDIAPRIADAEIVKRVHDDHRAHAPLVAELVTTCETLRGSPEQHPALRMHLGEVVRQLANELESHMELEERTVFPAVRQLGPNEQAAIVLAMQRRRKPRA